MSSLSATWLGTGRQPTCAPNPAYPNGIALDAAGPAPGCEIALKYPAPCIGQWVVECATCGTSAAVTAAGRADDPASVRIPCKMVGSA